MAAAQDALRGKAACMVAQPSLSLHHFRAQRRHAVRCKQEARIKELEVRFYLATAELDSWRRWYHSESWPRDCVQHESDEIEIAQRLSAISPVIHEHTVAAREHRKPIVPGSARLRRNVASHVFTEGLDFSNDAQLRSAQRGTHGRFCV